MANRQDETVRAADAAGPGADAGERARLIAERADADRRYNDKLTAVDAVVRPAPTVRGGPAPDARDLSALDRLVSIAPPAMPGAATGWRGALRTLVWDLVAPIFQRQQALNAAFLSELKAQAAAQRETASVASTSATVLRDELDALATFESQLAQYLQQVTPFIDTKMRVLEHAMEELRMSATAAQRASAATRRDIDRLRAGSPQRPPAGAPAPDAPVRADGPSSGDSYKYVGFEDCFRGSDEEIRARLADYARYFAGASDVLDIGCGRGEFLDLLKSAGVRARGIDANDEMAAICRARGLDVRQADALAYLRAQPDESLGGLLAAQVVEHLEPPYLVQLLEAAQQKLRPGALLVLETINPACWVAFFESYIRDITHVRPLHPDTLKYLVVASGFHDVNVQFRAPIAEAGKLERLAAAAGGGDAAGRALNELTRAFNANMDRLNERMFTFLDYAIVAVR